MRAAPRKEDPLYPLGRAGAIAASVAVQRLVYLRYYTTRPKLPELLDPYVSYYELTVNPLHILSCVTNRYCHDIGGLSPNTGYQP